MTVFLCPASHLISSNFTNIAPRPWSSIALSQKNFGCLSHTPVYCKWLSLHSHRKITQDHKSHQLSNMISLTSLTTELLHKIIDNIRRPSDVKSLGLVSKDFSTLSDSHLSAISSYPGIKMMKRGCGRKLKLSPKLPVFFMFGLCMLVAAADKPLSHLISSSAAWLTILFSFLTTRMCTIRAYFLLKTRWSIFGCTKEGFEILWCQCISTRLLLPRPLARK